MGIREFNLERDYDAVLALWRAAAPGVGLGPSDTRVEVAKKLARDPDLFLVMEAGETIVGAVMGGFDGRRGLVYHLAIAAEHRGQHLGTQLMTELERRLKAKGCRKCYLLVTASDTRVVDFYHTLGWAEMPVTLMGKEIA